MYIHTYAYTAGANKALLEFFKNEVWSELLWQVLYVRDYGNARQGGKDERWGAPAATAPEERCVCECVCVCVRVCVYRERLRMSKGRVVGCNSCNSTERVVHKHTHTHIHTCMYRYCI
jgi:hypothetical protein